MDCVLKFNQGFVQSVEFLKYENLQASFSDLGNEGQMKISAKLLSEIFFTPSLLHYIRTLLSRVQHICIAISL